MCPPQKIMVIIFFALKSLHLGRKNFVPFLDLHVFGFVGFMIFSELYMLLTLFLFKKSRSDAVWSANVRTVLFGLVKFSCIHVYMSCISLLIQIASFLQDKKSFTWKKYITVFNISTFMCAGYAYYRHNAFCEPGGEIPNLSHANFQQS